MVSDEAWLVWLEAGELGAGAGACGAPPPAAGAPGCRGAGTVGQSGGRRLKRRSRGRPTRHPTHYQATLGPSPTDIADRHAMCHMLCYQLRTY